MFPLLVNDIVINYQTISDILQPAISDFEDLEYEVGSLGNIVEWTVSGFDPLTYELWRDDEILTSDSWTGENVIEFPIDNLTLGIYNYTIVVYGNNDVAVADSVFVTVVDTTPPILDHPTDIIGNISAVSIQVIWQPRDLLPFNYAIYVNGSLVGSGNWTDGEYLTYTLTNIAINDYNITIVVWDTSGNFATDTVFVNIQQLPIQTGGNLLVIGISIGSIAIIMVIAAQVCRSQRGAQSAPPEPYGW
jgi:hypothetical protein